MSHRRIHDAELLAYAAGELSPEEARHVEAALAADADLARRVSLYRLARQRVAEDDSVAPPATTIARLKAIYHPADQGSLGEVVAEWLQRLERSIAGIIYDSRLTPATVRSATAGLDRIQLSYEAEGVEVDLQAEARGPAGDHQEGVRWHLIGQVAVRGDERAAEVAACRAESEEAVAETSCDGGGMFTLDLGAGTYDLHLRIGDRIVSLRGIELQ